MCTTLKRQQQKEDKKKAAETLQDRLLTKEKAMYDARANDQGVTAKQGDQIAISSLA